MQKKPTLAASAAPRPFVVVLFPPIHRMRTRVLGVLNKEAQHPPLSFSTSPGQVEGSMERQTGGTVLCSAQLQAAKSHPSCEQYRNMLNQSESVKIFDDGDRGLIGFRRRCDCFGWIVVHSKL